MTTGFIIGAGGGIDGGSGLELCDIGMALYVDETKGLRRYLNGQIVDINTNTQAFLNRLLEIKNTNPELFTTESNWQSEATLNIDGCVYKFVLNYSGDNVVSVRLPKYPDYVEINAGGTLPVVGNGIALGLTDGTNYAGLCTYSNSLLESNIGNYGSVVGSAISGADLLPSKVIGITTDPTKSGIQTTLKQTKLKMRYFIQIATGSETENNIINDIELNNPYSLFDSKYSDHELNNLSWLKSEGQWNAKSVYTDAYDKLLKVQNGTETVTGLSVKLSTETYTDYDFVLNTTDETFRLPLKTKQKFYDNTAPVVGNGLNLGLTEGSRNFGLVQGGGDYPGLACLTLNYGQAVGSQTSGNQPTSGLSLGVTTDPTKSGLETHLTETTLYLYFYVGETVQNANLINAGRIGEQLANKQDKLIRYPIAVSDKSLMPSWYVVYNDGWCEQGGIISPASAQNTNITVTLLKPYINTNYHVSKIIQTGSSANSSWYIQYFALTSKTTSSFSTWMSTDAYSQNATWEAKGYIS